MKNYAPKVLHIFRCLALLFFLSFISKTSSAQLNYTFSPISAAPGQTFTLIFTGPSNIDTIIDCSVILSGIQDTILSTCVNGFATIIDSMHQSVEFTIPQNATPGSYELFYTLAIHDPIFGSWMFEFNSFPNAFTINTFTPVQSSIQNIETVFQLSPNPTATSCTITAPNFTNAMLVIYDITGRALLQQPFNEHATVNVAALTPGMYVVEVRDKEGRSLKGKMVRE